MPVKEPKTKPTAVPVETFLAGIEDPKRREEGGALHDLFRAVTGEAGTMWGENIVGYGTYQSSTGPWPRTGFSPRKANLVLYIMPGFEGAEALLAKLGRHSTGKVCLYMKRLSDADPAVLRALVAAGNDDMLRRYPQQA